MWIRKKDVARFDVAMDEIVFERRVEPFGDLDADLKHLDLCQTLLNAHEIVERTFFGQLHRQIELAMVFTERKHFDHMRVAD